MVTDSVEVVELTAGTGWIRDDGPTFLIDDGGARRGVDWDFNNWGYAGQSRFSKNFNSYLMNDANEAAQRLLEYEGANCYRAPLVLEGGSIHSDGLGTVITTEECLLNSNRNPNLGEGRDRGIPEGLSGSEEDHLASPWCLHGCNERSCRQHVLLR